VLAYTDEDFAEAIDHLAHGRIDAGKIITTIAPLEETQEWFEDLTSGHTRQVKVLLAP
jgi:threonine dehydrogenase-like Zn-dependent dehydrogenase